MISYIEKPFVVRFRSCYFLPSHRVSYRMESLLVWQIKGRLILGIIELRVWREPYLVEHDFFFFVKAPKRCC